MVVTLEQYPYCLERGEIPLDVIVVDTGNSWSLRRRVIDTYFLYPLLTRLFVEELAAELCAQVVLEVFAGRGWLARALGEKGIRVIATDNYSWSPNFPSPFCAIERIDAVSAVLKYRQVANVLLMSWPPMNDVAAAAVAQWPRRKAIVYIGEGEGGFTASSKFWSLFQERKEIRSLRSWPHVYDRCLIGYRKR